MPNSFVNPYNGKLISRDKRIFEDMQDPSGFPMLNKPTLSFVDGTRRFTITPATDNFRYYYHGKEIIKTEAESITINNVEGLHAIYYDGDTLTVAENPTTSQIDAVIRE